jgi:predicted RNA-binding Zn ribbon-like protein
MPALGAAPFRFDYGRLSLDLVATVRRRRSSPVDLLTDRADATRWLRTAGLLPDGGQATEDEFRRLVALREAINALCRAALVGAQPNRRHIHLLNDDAAAAVERIELDARWHAHVRTTDPVELAIARIARDAVQLLGTDETRELLRACEQDDCGTLFVDTSPGRRRRWCSMSRCGSRAKVKTFRERHQHAS